MELGLKGIFHHKERFSFLCSLLRVEPAQRMTVTELLEHQWLNEGTVPDVPLDTPSIIVSDEVCHSDFGTVKLSPSWMTRKKKNTAKNGRAKSWKQGAHFSPQDCARSFFPRGLYLRRGTTRSL